MSSHHFVKEGQEPALFIIHPFNYELISPLLEWAPLVVVSEEAVDAVLQWGVKIDVVLVDASRSAAMIEKMQPYAPVKILSLQPNEELLLTGLYFLQAVSQQAVNIISAATETVFKQLNLAHTTIQINLLDSSGKWSFITSGKFEKWLPDNQTLILRPLKSDQLFQLKGLTRSANTLTPVQSGMVSITANDFFWIGTHW